jgi:hypothetical protein
MRWTWHVARMGEQVTVGNPEGKRPLGRAKCRWVDNRSIEKESMEWYGLH